MTVENRKEHVEGKCAKCGISLNEGDLFCRKCGTMVEAGQGARYENSPFEKDLMELLKTLREFRMWIDQSKKKNVRFMRAYKERIKKQIGPSIRAFDEKYREREEGRSPQYGHIMEIFSWLSRPITYMETELRPSVGMGVFLERWMLTKAAESYLRECCQEADLHMDQLIKSTGLVSDTEEQRTKG